MCAMEFGDGRDGVGLHGDAEDFFYTKPFFVEYPKYRGSESKRVDCLNFVIVEHAFCF